MIPVYSQTGEESYNNMWQKSRSIWKYIGKHFTGKYDFFLLGGDDMWFIVENLRLYLGNRYFAATHDKKSTAEYVVYV